MNISETDKADLPFPDGTRQMLSIVKTQNSLLELIISPLLVFVVEMGYHYGALAILEL